MNNNNHNTYPKVRRFTNLKKQSWFTKTWKAFVGYSQFLYLPKTIQIFSLHILFPLPGMSFLTLSLEEVHLFFKVQVIDCFLPIQYPVSLFPLQQQEVLFPQQIRWPMKWKKFVGWNFQASSAKSIKFVLSPFLPETCIYHLKLQQPFWGHEISLMIEAVYQG